MKIHICDDNKVFPFLYVDDWYTKEEEKLVWRELDFYTYRPEILFHRSENDDATGSYDDGTSKSKAWRIYLNQLYTQRDTSNILRLQPLKIQSDEIQKAISKTGANFRMYKMTNYDTIMVGYYAIDDYYEAHSDNFMMTVFCWFYRKPKAYTGGDIIFTDSNINLESKHNRMVMFPGYYSHKVHPIKMKNKNPVLGSGRYSIINFYGQRR